MHIKAEEALKRTELKLMIPPIRENTNNVYAYIDVGFCPVLSDETCALNCFNKADYESIAKMAVPDNTTQSISFVGQSIVFSPGGLTTSNGVIPAHANNFIEIMCDGSAKFRILLSNNDTSNYSVNFVLANVFLCQFQDVYSAIFGEVLKKHFIMARKYEKLTVLKQFYPVYRFNDPSLFLSQPELIEKDAKIADAANKHRTIFGTSRIITDDRIPKDGLYSLDDQHFQKYGLNIESDLISELFRSEFAYLGLSRAPNNE